MKRIANNRPFRCHSTAWLTGACRACGKASLRPVMKQEEPCGIQ